MLYRLAADAVVLLHLAFVVFVVLGGLLVLRRPKVAWLHLPAAAWGAWIELSDGICPLTPLENRLRRLGGEAGYEGGFIDEHVVGILYPEGLTRGMELALGLFVVVLTALVYGRLIWRLRARRRARPDAASGAPPRG